METDLPNDSVHPDAPETLTPYSPAQSQMEAENPSEFSGDKTKPLPASAASDAINVLRGFCMGAADTVPGVSGGTVALILGHYHRLVSAISQVDASFFRMLSQRKFREAFLHLDGRFLIALGTGIGIGVMTLSGLMHWLLDHRMSETLAVFLGLMIASVWVVQRYISRWTMGCFAALVAGIVAAVTITLLPMANGNSSLPYLFFSASVAICAMILPGISGAFVLLLLGVYHTVTGLIKDAARGNVTIESVTQILVFGLGCILGLLGFSRLLKRLLQHHRNVTMSALMGLMIGSIGKLWPLQRPTVDTANEELKFRVMEYVAPGQWPGSLVVLTGLVIASLLFVLVIERFSAASDSETA